MEVLVVGCENSGKSLLVKRLHFISSAGLETSFLETNSSTIPTIGNNITKINIDKVECTLREVGGAMAPIWKNYYDNATALIYVIDKSNQFQVSMSCILLLTLLSNEKLFGKKVLIVFNKTDLITGLSTMELKKIYRFNELLSHAKQEITFVESSCLNKKGFEEICKWLSSVSQVIR